MNSKSRLRIHGHLFSPWLVVLATMSLQAQWTTRVNFSAAEGYVDGPVRGQPAGTGTPTWICVSENTGDTYVPEDGIRHICRSITNGALCIRPDQNLGELTAVMYWTFPFPAQRKGSITVTWDWRFFPTDEIPTDYDPTNNNYRATLGARGRPGSDHRNWFHVNVRSGHSPSWLALGADFPPGSWRRRPPGVGGADPGVESGRPPKSR